MKLIQLMAPFIRSKTCMVVAAVESTNGWSDHRDSNF